VRAAEWRAKPKSVREHLPERSANDCSPAKRFAILRRRTKSIAVLAICLGVSAAIAADVSITSRITEAFEASDNEFLRTTNAKPSGGAFTTADLNVVARVPTWRFEGNANVNYRKYFGPAVEDFSTTDTTAYGARLFAEHKGKLSADREFVEWTYRRANAGLEQLQQQGFATTQGDFIAYAARGGLTRQITQLDQFVLFGSFTSTTFEPRRSGTPFTDALATATWRREVSRTTNVFLSSSIDWLSYDDLAQRRVAIIRNVAGVDTRLTHDLLFKASAGAVVARSLQEGIVGSSLTAANASAVVDLLAANPFVTPFDPFGTGSAISPLRDRGWVTGWVGDVSLRYLLKTGELSVYANQTIAPNTLGQVQESRSIGAAARYDINRRESLFAATRYSQLLAGAAQGGDSEYFNATAGYSNRFAREWLATLTYTYSHRWADNGNARANTVLLSISRDLSILPGT
jgi:hypothetical protein